MTSIEAPILILGGTGTVGSRIASQLASQGIPTLIASRNPPPSSSLSHVNFDWDDPYTWEPIFLSKTNSTEGTTTEPEQAQQSSKPQPAPQPIKSIYLVAPPSLSGDRPMIEFIEFARSRGVHRFILQSASSIEAGGPLMGKVHAYLRELGQRGDVEWGVLRPTWFQQNIAEQPTHKESIRSESKIYSATEDGKIPWVSADDIASVAVRALTGEEAPNTEWMVLGPELLSYDEIAEILTEVLGRKIVHVDLSSAELEKRHARFGMPEEYARMMSAMDTAIKFGAENRTNDVIFSVTGTAPKKFRDYAMSVKDVWETRMEGMGLEGKA
ncbi:uncharacterized protein QC761_106810 [Podospora bellae-mahoneyi]|uniref:NmrA-like domain-containing protein n=2 Tax=Podospora TaxID=5144 RepID=A0ABY6RV24_PODCO|nr:hypothetical protein QC761_106810 [Podospora bellae-mahoneyi]VBB72097.1 Putative protein of unknown function [Podospora comata]